MGHRSPNGAIAPQTIEVPPYIEAKHVVPPFSALRSRAPNLRLLMDNSGIFFQIVGTLFAYNLLRDSSHQQ
jgi:hypothetical protein